jgi:hypothetical protein
MPEQGLEVDNLGGRDRVLMQNKMTRAPMLPFFDLPQRLPGGLHFPSRMTVLPLANRAIALVSPIPVDEDIAGRVAALGEVKFLIAPNLLHHLYLAGAIARWPSASVLAPGALRRKRPDSVSTVLLKTGHRPSWRVRFVL